MLGALGIVLQLACTGSFGRKQNNRLSSSFLGLPYRILNMNHKKEILRGLWEGSSSSVNRRPCFSSLHQNTLHPKCPPPSSSRSKPGKGEVGFLEAPSPV